MAVRQVESGIEKIVSQHFVRADMWDKDAKEEKTKPLEGSENEASKKKKVMLNFSHPYLFTNRSCVSVAV